MLSKSHVIHAIVLHLDIEVGARIQPNHEFISIKGKMCTINCSEPQKKKTNSEYEVVENVEIHGETRKRLEKHSCMDQMLTNGPFGQGYRSKYNLKILRRLLGQNSQNSTSKHLQH